MEKKEKIILLPKIFDPRGSLTVTEEMKTSLSISIAWNIYMASARVKNWKIHRKRKLQVLRSPQRLLSYHHPRR